MRALCEEVLLERAVFETASKILAFGDAAGYYAEKSLVGNCFKISDYIAEKYSMQPIVCHIAGGYTHSACIKGSLLVDLSFPNIVLDIDTGEFFGNVGYARAEKKKDWLCSYVSIVRGFGDKEKEIYRIYPKSYDRKFYEEQKRYTVLKEHTTSRFLFFRWYARDWNKVVEVKNRKVTLFSDAGIESFESSWNDVFWWVSLMGVDMIVMRQAVDYVVDNYGEIDLSKIR